MSDPTGLFCVWDDGSYDSADDPDTGSYDTCNKAGGTWFNGKPSDWGLADDWSSSSNDLNAYIAFLANFYHGSGILQFTVQLPSAANNNMFSFSTPNGTGISFAMNPGDNPEGWYQDVLWQQIGAESQGQLT